jgi:serine/threonine-protein kinase
MLWEAATGLRMWNDENDPAIMYRVANGDIPSPRDANPEVSPELERICMKALAPDRALRYATALELEEDLEAVIDTLGKPVTSREIASLVTNLFEDARAETRNAIEERLRSVASLSAAEYQELESSAHTLQALHHSSTRSTTLPVAAPKSRAISVALGAAGAVLVGIVVWLMLSWRTPVTSASPDASTAAAPAVPAVTAPVPPPAMTAATGSAPEIALARSAPVPAATGAASAAAPSGGSVGVKSSASRSASLSAPPHTAPPRTAPLGSVVPRSADPPPDPAISPDEKPKPAAGPSAAPSATPRANCNPPYYIDDRGIKKYKPECL